MSRRFSFDTSAFLPAKTRSGQWQRFTLEMTAEQEEAIFSRREDLAEQASREGRWAKSRAYDRQIVKRYSV